MDKRIMRSLASNLNNFIWQHFTSSAEATLNQFITPGVIFEKYLIFRSVWPSNLLTKMEIFHKESHFFTFAFCDCLPKFSRNNF